MASLRRQETIPSLILVSMLMLLTWFSFNFFENQKPDLTEIYGKKWIFQYAIENGEREMEYLDEFNKRDWLRDFKIWITFTTQTPVDAYGCNRSDRDINIPKTASCFIGYDGCNEMSGLVTLSKNGSYQLYSIGGTLLGCPTDITKTQENPDGTVNLQFHIIYDSDPFQQALIRSTAYDFTNTELKLYYPTTQQNYLLFYLEEKP